MIKHIVLFKIKKNINDDNICQLLEELGKLRFSTIPQIKNFTSGKSCNQESGRNNGYNYVIEIEFLSINDLKIYTDHPDHIKFVETLKLYLVEGSNSVLAFDYHC